jgi:hypothetical protein
MAGRGAANLWFAYPNIYFPFINAAKGIQDPWRPSGTPSEDVYACFDDNGYPTKLPSGVTQFTGFFYIYLIDHTTDRWVMTWDGADTGIALSCTTTGITTTLTANTTNRREYTFTGSAYPAGKSLILQITISAVNEASPITNIKVFRESEEARMNAGHNWPQHMIDLLTNDGGVPMGRVRLMDFQEVNNSALTEWAGRSLSTDHTWTGSTLRKALYAGEASQTSNNYVAAGTRTGNPTAWTDGMTVYAKLTNAITSKTIVAITEGNPTSIEVTSHGFSNGDLIMFDANTVPSGDYENNLNFRFFEVTSTGANTFTIPIDSTGWSGSYSSGGTLFKQVTFATSTLPAKRVMGRDGGTIPPSRFAVNDVRQFTYNEVFDCLMYTLGPTSGGVGGGGASQMQRTGVPIDLLVELVNEAEVNPHFCIPIFATDDYITQFATYVRDNLDSSLHAVYELSNEVWNPSSGFLQSGQAWRQARILWPAGVGENDIDQTGISNWYGMRFQEMAALLDTVYTGLTGRHVKAFATWAAMTSQGYRDNRYQAPLASLAAYPILSADEIHIAPYCEPTRSVTSNAEQVWKYKQGGADRTAALDWAEALWRAVSGTSFTLDYLIDTLFPLHYGDAQTYGVKLAWYEGGWGGIPSLCTLTATSHLGEALLASPITITGAANNGSGLIRLTMGSTATLTDGQSYYVVGVYGTSEANGLWEMTVVNGTTVDLVGSTFTNTYVAGGLIESDRDNFFYGFHGSDQWAEVANDLLQGFADIGVDCVYPNYYTLVAARGSTGIWGLRYDTALGTDTPAMAAVQRFNARKRRYRVQAA